MNNNSNRKFTRRAAEQTATSLVRLGKKVNINKARVATNCQVLPQFEIVEKNYGHTVITIGKKRVEITPLYEIEPIEIEAPSLLIEHSARPKRKKSRLELIKQIFRIMQKN